MRTRSTRRPWLTAAAAVVLLLTLTACGGGGGGGNDDVATLGADTAEDDDGSSSGDGEVTEAEREDAMVEFTECMREHGVDMPDPVMQGDGSQRSVTMEVGGPGQQIDPEDFEAADEACRHFMEDVMGERPQLSPEEEAEMRDNMLAFSECMREHGIDMPDPEFESGGGGGMMRIGPGDGMDFDDEDFQAAQEACRGELGSEDGAGGGPVMGFKSSAAAGSES